MRPATTRSDPDPGRDRRARAGGAARAAGSARRFRRSPAGAACWKTRFRPRTRSFSSSPRRSPATLSSPCCSGRPERDHGIHRLLKALRHDVPGPAATAARIGVGPAAGDTTAVVFKTYHQAAHRQDLAGSRLGRTAPGWRHARRSTLCRHLPDEGARARQADHGRQRRGGRARAHGCGRDRPGSSRPPASRGGNVAFAERLSPLFSLAINVENRADEVKLTAALHKLVEEDPSLSLEHSQDTHELVLWGQERSICRWRSTV